MEVIVINPKNICNQCGKIIEGNVYVFGGETLCGVCDKKIGEGLDEIELRRILNSRGIDWIEKFLARVLKEFYGRHK